MGIKIYNTLTRKKEDFIPREPGRVSMYVCGPTTYNLIHLGNARPLIVFDTFRRYLEYCGYQVTFVQNFTDIDDKIIKQAWAEKEDPLKLSARYIEEYWRDADRLGIKRATVHPKVTEHIPDIIEMIQGIIDNGHAYVVDGDVYFDVKSFPSYGKLSRRTLEEMKAGARVEIDERKKDPMDFALWKRAKEGEPSWDSPWGPGRPGWHIECSAMSLKYLGKGFDIHGGGQDLIFPHHENELAQAEAYAGEGAFARYWMHNGYITVNEEKMSKSLGNFFTLREILERYDPDTVRFYMLSTHYRSPLDFDDTKMEAAQKGLERLANALANLEHFLSKLKVITKEADPAARYLQDLLRETEIKFREAMDDDFNTALAIGILFDLVRELNSWINRITADEVGTDLYEAFSSAFKLLKRLTGVLGLFQREERGQEDLVQKLVNLLIELRQEARRKKDWATADAIREKLRDLGIILEDTPQGVRWRYR